LQNAFRVGEFHHVDPSLNSVTGPAGTIRLEPKVMQVLLCLADHAGHVVAKERLMRTVWPNTFVGDDVLTRSISELRRVFGDDVKEPRYIQTIPKSGYRLIAGLSSNGEQDLVESRQETAKEALPAVSQARRQTLVPAGHREAVHPPKSVHWGWFALVTAVAGVIAAAALLWRAPALTRQSQSGATPPTATRITAQPSADPVLTSCISPDGKFMAYSARAGVHVRVIASGETRRLATTEGMEVLAWSADGTGIVAAQLNGQTYTGWDLPLFASPRRSGIEWPANNLVAFARQGTGVARADESGEIWVRLNDAPEKKVFQAERKGQYQEWISTLTWSADGKRLFFSKGAEIYQVDLSGAAPAWVATVPGVSLPGPEAGGMSTVALAQLNDGRLVIETVSENGSELLQLPLSRETGLATGQIARLTSVAEGLGTQLSVSDDGKYIAYQKVHDQSDIYIADLDTARPRLGALQRLTMDERNDKPLAWVPDGSAVVFYSDRNGSMDIFKQRIDSDTAEPLVTGAGTQYLPRVTSDGRWVLFVERGTQGSYGIMRVPLDGGRPEQILTKSDYAAPRCAARGQCVVLEARGESMTVSEFDPVRGRGRELATLPLSHFGADVSPTGNEFAFVVPDAEPRRRIRVVSFIGKAPKDIIVGSAGALANLDWLPDGSGFLTVNRSLVRADLLLVHLDGHADVLWSGDRQAGLWALPAPDGKRVALHVVTRQSDVWMLQAF